MWIGNKLSDMQFLCIHSFIAHGHDFHLYAYNNIENISPLNTNRKFKLCDANEIVPHKRIFTALGSYAAFSDWFRWELLQRKGGWYVDMDMVCLRPFDFSEEIIFGRESIHTIGTAVLKFPAGHSMALAIANACAKPGKIQPWDDRTRIKWKLRRRVKFWKDPYSSQSWGESGGPHALSLAINYFNLQDMIQPPRIFYPLNLDSINYLLSSDQFSKEFGEVIINNSHGLHLFNYGWSAVYGWKKDRSVPHDCLYEKLKRHYIPDYISNQAK